MKRIRVLVVDDAAFMRDLMKKALRAGYPGFRLDEAFHGRQAQQLLRQNPYDLVMCDWEMPELTGMELLEWMRGQPALEDLPFIMVTSRGDKEHVLKAIELKANNYIVKPYTTEKLIAVVGHVLSKSMNMTIKELRAHGANGARPGEVTACLSGAVPIAETIVTGAGATRTVRVKEKRVVQLRFADTAAGCLLSEVGYEMIRGVLRRGGPVPAILEQVVLDLQSDGEIARLNGYVHTLQARDEQPDSELVNITVGLVEQDDPKKRAFLERFMKLVA